MANGIKLRRGLKTALSGTIADGEFVFCTDSGELGFKKGTVEKYIDLEKLSTDIDDLQTEVDELQASVPGLFSGQFKHKVNLFYDYDVVSKPTNNGGYMIPIAKVNPLFTSDSFELTQVIYVTNSLVSLTNFDEYGVLQPPYILGNDYLIIKAVNDGHGGFTLQYDKYESSADLSCEILDDGYGNTTIYAVITINSTTTSQLRVAFDIDCISVIGEGPTGNPYSVFLPPTDLPIILKQGQS